MGKQTYKKYFINIEAEKQNGGKDINKKDWGNSQI